MHNIVTSHLIMQCWRDYDINAACGESSKPASLSRTIHRGNQLGIAAWLCRLRWVAFKGTISHTISWMHILEAYYL